ncbi:hypothetical protein [Microbacterium sp. ProA8]|uniref:hypothetical protein n=1 Tax=Microbacterium chionoecetis TaxID=3153754 RepID=UPI003267DDBA
MTFPIDFATHQKVSRLSDSAFRTFIEANGYSRVRESDGRIEVADAEFMWPTAALDELCASHPTRPLMFRDGDEYVLRDYAEHQFTKADRDALTEKRSRAGRASADKRRTHVEQVLSTSQHTPTEIETGIEISPSNEGDSPRKRAHPIPANFTITDRMRQWAAENVPLVDIDKVLPEFIDYWRGVGKAMKDWESVWHNGMRKQQGFAERDQQRHGPKQSKAAVNAAEYRRLFGNGSQGSVPAIDAGISP